MKKGQKHTTKTKELMGIAKRGNTYGFKKGQQSLMKGRKHLDTSRKQMSESHRGIKLSEQHKHSMSLSKMGRKLSTKHRLAISNGKSGIKKTEGHKQKLRIAATGRKFSEQTKQKHREWSLAHPNRKFRNTTIELRMRALLDALGVHYIREYVVRGIARVDFYIPEKNLIIECDGCYWHGCPIHFPNNLIRLSKTQIRSKKLRGAGYKVLNFWEHEIKSMNILEL